MFIFKRRIKLQRLLVAALLLVLLPAVVIQAWFSYHTTNAAAIKFEKQLASEVSARVFDKVLQFFEVPNRVVRFNAEQFRAGILSTADSQAMQRHFLLQLDQYSVLTFLSIGTANGEYFAASRPPLGEDRALRLIEATEDKGRYMSTYRVNAQNKPGDFIAKSALPFDARVRPWFKSVLGYNNPRWYPAYRYLVPDTQGAYNSMGIGMAAPLYNPKGDFVGTMTADVSLVQLSKLLESITKDLGGTAFLYDEGGDLLATSTLEELYDLKSPTTVRVKAINSTNTLIRATSKIIHASSETRGRTVSTINNERYLLDWWQYPLPDGPTVTIANVVPQSRFNELSRGLLLNVLFFSAAIFILGLILTIFVSKWVARPLVKLGEWATLLGQGTWQETYHPANPIAEVESLSKALQRMANSVKYHNDHLKEEVAARTAELELANSQLAQLSNTDGLTGVANRRYFDETLAKEVAQARRTQEPLSLIMLDVDFFKKYNDQYGHVAGDHCLIKLATTLKNNTRRPSDLTARYGGEEFVIIVPHSNATESLALAEILRIKIEELGIAHALPTSDIVTASFGVASFVPDEQHGANELIQMADKALYRAKENGRNRVELAA